MNKKTIRSILEDALEEEIPPSEVNLWPAVRASLVAGNHQQGETMKTKRRYSLPRVAFAVAVLVALLAAALLTPQGRALSQSILEFFARAEETAAPVAPSQSVAGEPGADAPTAEPPAPLISVAEAEAQAGFGVAELPFVPDGLDYLGARLYGDAVSIEYQTPSFEGHLIIMQSQEGFVQSEWDRVPADAVVPVRIGEWDGEFVEGTFVVYAGETVGTWNPDAPMLRLRWVQDGVWFEMTKTGNAEALAYLDRAGLIELAESLAIRP
ncbi:MAG: hypothetical protein P8189_24850 [Anaerolineae bacterium]